MSSRRNFLKLGALFVPAAIAEPRRVYSFLWAPRYVWVPVQDDRQARHQFRYVSVGYEVDLGSGRIGRVISVTPLVVRADPDFKDVAIKGSVSI